MSDFKIRINEIKNIDAELSDIKVGKRFRGDLGDVAALAQSITKEGLIHPICVAINEEEDYKYKLVAGGRRFAAISLIAEKTNITTVSCRLYEKKLSELDLRSLEFAENLYRKDLTWQEEVKLKERILSLQQKIHGAKISTSPGASGFSLSDLSTMTGKSKGSLSGDITLAKMINDTPEIDWNQFSSKSDAMKAVKRAKEVVKTRVDAKEAENRMGSGDSFKKRLVDSYHIKDFFEGVSNLGDASFDLVELDPPYSIDLENQKKGYNYTGYNEIDPKKYPDFMRKVFKECYRVLKPNSWLICWFGPEPWFESMHQWIVDAGFKNKRMPASWIKGEENDDHVVERTSGQCMQPERDLAKASEFFFYARKGVPTLNKPGSTNTFGYKPIHASSKVHPTERPIEMIQDILNTFTGPNSNILVPFAGSGNTLLAAANLKMTSFGFDLTEEFKESYIIKIHKTF